MIIQLDLQSDTPIYVQLKNQIIEGIAAAKLAPGEPLPSVRTMAADLGVNMHTVNKAYQLLKQDGFIQIHRQKGVIIHPAGEAKVDDVYLAKLVKELRPLLAEAKCRGMEKGHFYELCEQIFAEFAKAGEDGKR
jgi:DNA-binding transcriptional regulator YhcF (GntR family)